MDVSYGYTDDRYGNWTQMQMSYAFGGKAYKPIMRRTIEYY